MRFLTKLVEFILKGASNVVIVNGVVNVVLIWEAIDTGVYPSFSVMKNFPSLVNIR